MYNIFILLFIFPIVLLFRFIIYELFIYTFIYLFNHVLIVIISCMGYHLFYFIIIIVYYLSIYRIGGLGTPASLAGPVIMTGFHDCWKIECTDWLFSIDFVNIAVGNSS